MTGLLSTRGWGMTDPRFMAEVGQKLKKKAADFYDALPDTQFYKDVGGTLVEGATDPETYKGAVKEAAFGLAGLPGDIGYVMGNAPAVYNAYQEGLPLFENVGPYADTPMTTDYLAKKMGTPFTGAFSPSA